MRLNTVSGKNLNQIEYLAKQLLLVLNNLDSDEPKLSQDLTVLAIETHNEQQLRTRLDKAQQLQEATSKINTWENEGGNMALAVE